MLKRRKMKMKDVYVLVINTNQTGSAEDISTVVSTSVESLIDYVINEELPEQGYSYDDIIDMGADVDLSDDLYWKDPEGVEYSINESKMI